MAFQKIGSFKNTEAFKNYLTAVVGETPMDDSILAGMDSPLAADAKLRSPLLRFGNRWAIQPMEGWDALEDGNPSDATLRRWKNFGLSGAKLIWGGEAVAVRNDARANPNQLVCQDSTLAGLDNLRTTLTQSHRQRWGNDEGLVLGLQLTHSGRFCEPHKKGQSEPKLAYCHPILDRRLGNMDSTSVVLTDGEVGELIETFVVAAIRAQKLGFQFVDIKHCHGYLLHEFLGAHTRPGSYGGSFENRTRILREIVGGIRRDAPDLAIGIRLSIFDLVPFRPDPQLSQGKKLGPGIPEDFSSCLPYQFGFGVNQDDPTRTDLTEGFQLLELLEQLDIRIINISGGSPYYNPHIQRPAFYPPSDGYMPPEDPLLGVYRQLHAVRDLKKCFPDLLMVGSAFSYLQEFLPHVAQAVIREGWMDFVGIGRMALTYWDLPGDCLEGKPLVRSRFCRTFSDCTTAPRHGLRSGCYPLDDYYSKSPEAETLKKIKGGKA